MRPGLDVPTIRYMTWNTPDRTTAMDVGSVFRFVQYDGSEAFAPTSWYEETVVPLRQLCQARTWGDLSAISQPLWLTQHIASVRSARAVRGESTGESVPFHVSDLQLGVADLWEAIDTPWGVEALSETVSVVLLNGSGPDVPDRDLLAELEMVVDTLTAS